MKPTPNQLKSSSDYALLDTLHFDNIMGFALKQLSRRNLVTLLFYLAMGIPGILLAILLVLHGIMKPIEIPVFRYALFGLLASFTLMIPIHEGIHGIAYLFTGAPRVQFGMRLDQGVFFAAADNHVLGRREFYVLALAPFLLITGGCVIGILLLPPGYFWFFLSLCFFHSTMCAGDFALLSYYREHRDKEIFTFDNLKEKSSYFYYRREG